MIGGVVLLIVGIALIVTGYEMRTNIDNIIPQVQQGYTVCNSPLGHLGSAIFGSLAERCALGGDSGDSGDSGGIFSIVYWWVRLDIDRFLN
jgi:hypothetical protein